MKRSNICLPLLAAFLASTVLGQTEAPRRIERVPSEPAGRPAATDDTSAGLFIGINRFQDAELANLEFAVNDAVELAYVMVVEHGRLPAENVVVCIEGEPTRDEVKQHLAELQRRGVQVDFQARRDAVIERMIQVGRRCRRARDLLLIAVSSHGFADGGEGYVMPADGKRGALADTAIRLQFFCEQMANSASENSILIADACQERRFRGARGTPVEYGARMSPDFSRAIAGSSQAMLVACSEGEYSYEDKSLQHGLFVKSLLEALRGGIAPGSDRTLQLGPVADYANDYVQQWVTRQNQARGASQFRQRPYFEGPLNARRIVLAVKPGPAMAASSPAPGTPAPGLLPRLKAPFGESDIRHARERWSQHTGLPLTFKNSLNQQFWLIPPGTFSMGSPPQEAERDDDETLHPVTLPRPFFIGACEVSQEEYAAIMEARPSWFAPGGSGSSQVRGLDTRQFPVESVSRQDAWDFCRKLTELDASPWRYRLPTEAEWEYACRAGAETPFSHGAACSSNLANCDGTVPYQAPAGGFLERPCPSGQYPPNAFGLHDMHGNVWEWCQDGYVARYEKLPSDSQGNYRRFVVEAFGSEDGVLRGGSWYNRAADCRSAKRLGARAGWREKFYGFRLVAEHSALEQPKQE